MLWHKTFGQTGSILSADGNLSHEIDSPDYDLWRANFGETNAPGAGGDASLSASAAATVPEPSTLTLMLIAAPLATFCCRRN